MESIIKHGDKEVICRVEGISVWAQLKEPKPQSPIYQNKNGEWSEKKTKAIVATGLYAGFNKVLILDGIRTIDSVG